MNRRLWSLMFALLLALFACDDGERSGPSAIRQDGASSADVSQDESQAPDSERPQPEPTAGSSGPVTLTTDRETYRPGETVVVAIENNSSDAIHFMALCSIRLCLRSGEEWICVERECDGPMNVVEAGGRLDIFEVAQLIGPDEAGDGDLRYKLDYQVGSEAPFHFVSSNAFTVRREGVNCEGARQIALEHARSSPYWGDLDVSRAAIRWQDESQSCTVDFAWRGTDQIRAGLWSEGYVVTVAAGSGRVTEANAYER